MTNIDSLWKTHVGARYAKLERNRSYALPNDAKRFLCWLWVACERLDRDNAGKLFESSLEQFADAGVNVLQPKPPADIEPPAMWKDLWNRDLPNPFDKAAPDLQGQSLVQQRDPKLAQWLKAFAESPYRALCEWQDQQAATLKRQAITYNADSHAINPWVNGADETTKGQFVKNAPPEVVERCRWESREVTFPAAGKNFDLTATSKIATVPRLNAIWSAMNEQEREFVMAEKASLRQQQSEAAARLKALEAASGTPEPPRMAQRARIGAE